MGYAVKVNRSKAINRNLIAKIPDESENVQIFIVFNGRTWVYDLSLVLVCF
jgi:hypothetical protein